MKTCELCCDRFAGLRAEFSERERERNACRLACEATRSGRSDAADEPEEAGDQAPPKKTEEAAEALSMPEWVIESSALAAADAFALILH